MMETLLWLGILAAIFILGIRLGMRFARAGQQIDDLIAAHADDMEADRVMDADDMTPDVSRRDADQRITRRLGGDR